GRGHLGGRAADRAPAPDAAADRGPAAARAWPLHRADRAGAAPEHRDGAEPRPAPASGTRRALAARSRRRRQAHAPDRGLTAPLPPSGTPPAPPRRLSLV